MGKCQNCGKTILTKEEFIKELAEKYSIEVDPYNVDRFKVSGVSSGFDAYNRAIDSVQAKYNEVQKMRAFKCQSCGNTYCMECLLNYAPSHYNGGKACLSCRGAFMEI
jgi:DNA-directed RNA polymerase subunit M/transcription elongation factor TFIIS